MQRFVKEDYYELDWHYEECADGNYCLCLLLWNLAEGLKRKVETLNTRCSHQLHQDKTGRRGLGIS